MTRDLRLLGLAALALLAIGGIAAQGAGANESHSFTSSAEPTELTGTGGVHKWVVEGELVMECAKATLSGYLATHSADELNLSPVFSGCKMGGRAARFEDKGCKTAFDSDTSPDIFTSNKEDAVVSLNCGHSGSYRFETEGEAESVVLTFYDTHPEGVPVNQELHGAKYFVSGPDPESDLKIEAHLSGLKFVCTGACWTLGLEEGTIEKGTTTGSFTVKGYADAAHTEQVSLGLSSP